VAKRPSPKSQLFRDNIRIVNNGGKTSITKIAATYWKDGKWEPVVELVTGSMVNGWRGERSFTSDTRIIPLNVGEKISFDLAVVSKITLQDAKAIEHRDIIHPGFGEPLRVQYTITCADGLVNQLVSEFVSRKLDFYDKAGWMKDNSVATDEQVLLYVECDDVTRLKRYRYCVWLSNEKELMVRCMQGSTYQSYDQKRLAIAGAQAVKESKKEVECMEPYSDGQAPYANVFRSWLLVDTPTGLVYGVRVHMKTSTGENQGSCLIPLDRIKSR